MANNIKRSGDALALQVTKPAREAGLVLEDLDGDPKRLANVCVYGFDDLLLVIDYDRVSESDRAEIVASAARDSKSIYQARRVSLTESGHGYQVQVPGAEDAGFHVGDKAPVLETQGILVIYKDGKTRRLADDVITQAGSWEQ